MIYPMIRFQWPLVTLDLDNEARFQGHAVIFRYIDALNVLCAQLTRDLFAIAKFLYDDDNDDDRNNDRSSRLLHW